MSPSERRFARPVRAGLPLAALAAFATFAAPVVPAQQATMYAGSWGPAGSGGGRVYRYETGTTWTEISPPGGLADAVWDLEWVDGELWTATHRGPESTEDPDVPHGSSGHVFRWDGSSWTEASPLGGFASAATTVTTIDGRVYVTVDHIGLVRHEGGTTWTILGEFTMAAQALVSDSHDGRPILYLGQDNTDEFWVYDPEQLLPCGSPPPGCQVPTGEVCSADCHPGSCIHALTAFDDGAGERVWAGAWLGRMYAWDPATRLFAQAEDVPHREPPVPNEHVQGLATYHGRLWAGLSTGIVRSSPDGRTATYALEHDFGLADPVSDMLAVPEDDLLWLGFGGVPWRWARRDGVSAVRSFDGSTWVERSLPFQFGEGVLVLLAVVPEVVCDAGAEQVLECTGGSVEVQLDGSASTWSQGFDATATWTGPFVEGTADGFTPTVHFTGPGEHEVELTVSVRGASESCTTLVRIVDTTPPALSSGEACLWPPNHRYRCFDARELVTAGSGDDACNGPSAVTIVGASSSQPEDSTGEGDGSTLDDLLFDADSACVRSEREGEDPAGRVYSIVLSSIDAAGNEALTVATLRVPHDQRESRRCAVRHEGPGLLPHARLPLEAPVAEGTYPAP